VHPHTSFIRTGRLFQFQARLFSFLSVSFVIIISSGETRRRLATRFVVGAVITMPPGGGVPWATGIKILYTDESDERNEEALPHQHRLSPPIPQTPPTQGSKNKLTSVILIMRHRRPKMQNRRKDERVDLGRREEKRKGELGKLFLTRPSQILSFCAYVSEGGDSMTNYG
jgi:hypothetical protein